MRKRTILLTRLLSTLMAATIALVACTLETATRPVPMTEATATSSIVETNIGTPTTKPVSGTTPTIALTAKVVPTRTPTMMPTVGVYISATEQTETSPVLQSQFVYFYEGIYSKYFAINYLASDPEGVSYPPKEISPKFKSQPFRVTVGFANFADRLRLWGYFSGEEDFRQVWISDMFGQNATLVFTETKKAIIGSFAEDTWWTPDDQHLVLQLKEPEGGFIYHLQSGELDAWPYPHCDQVALSPRSQRPVLWCKPISDGKDFAVIEWGGEIWFNPTAPEQILAQGENWAWSEGGQRLAYFSTDVDANGDLYIADEKGDVLQILPGIMAWSLIEHAGWPDRPLEWSADGRRLLILAPGIAEKPCLPNVRNEVNDIPIQNPPCWHIFDLESQKMIWDIPDSFETAHQYESGDFWYASISNDGRYLVLGVNGLDDRHRGTRVIDLDTHEKLWAFGVWIPFAMRWGPAFEADFSYP